MGQYSGSIIALSNHLLPVTDSALLEPDALTNLHAIVTIQKMQKDALEIQILEHKLLVGEVQTGILFPALKTYPI